MSQSVRTIAERDARCRGLPRAIPMTGNGASISHASPKRKREETATGVVRRHVFPCLRCGLGWAGEPAARAWMGGGTRRAGLDGRGAAACNPMTGNGASNSHASPKREREETATPFARAWTGAATSAGRGARRAGPFARASGWPPPPPPRSAARRSPRRSPPRHAAPAGSA